MLHVVCTASLQFVALVLISIAPRSRLLLLAGTIAAGRKSATSLTQGARAS